MTENPVNERALQLMLALDQIRDSLNITKNPQKMFDSIVEKLQSEFTADAVALLLINEETDSIDSLSFQNIEQEQAIQLCRSAMHHIEPTPIPSTWKHTLGMQINLETEEKVLGGIFIGRDSEAFNSDEMKLLGYAESQIDSAVMQARTFWQLVWRNRELEVIYEIDRISDEAKDENMLVNGLTHILVKHFPTQFCLIVLKHSDTDDLVIRSLIDRENFPSSTVLELQKLAENIKEPQFLQPTFDVKNLYVYAIPLIIQDETLGAVVIGQKAEFSLAEQQLLNAMMSQIDTAVAQVRSTEQLIARKKELEIIYTIDHIRDQDTEFDSMMQSVLQELCGAISSEMGYLMLYNTDNEQPLELKVTTKGASATDIAFMETIQKYSRQALDDAKLVYANELEGNVESIVAIPLILHERIIGVFGAVNSTNPDGFLSSDRRMLSAITSQVDTAVFEGLERRRMREVLSRSVDPKVVDYILEHADDKVLAGERVVISILFTDLRGSTEWAERTQPETLVTILNEFLGTMTDIIFQHGGTLDKFVGDEVIALFGTPVSIEDHAYRVAKTALQMQKVHQELQKRLKDEGKELPPIGIGVSTGEVIAGEFGTPIRTDFTAMGRVMNLASRLCDIANPQQIVISPITKETLGDMATVKTLDPITLKGIKESVQIYELQGLVDDAQ